MDTATQTSPSNSVPPSQRHTAGTSVGHCMVPVGVLAEYSSTFEDCYDNDSSPVGENHTTTPSETLDNGHEQIENCGSHGAGPFAYDCTTPQYNTQQSSFNGYITNGIYSGAPFDYRYHPHSDPQHQYYPYQETAMPAIQYYAYSNLPTHAYMAVYGPSPYYQHQGSPPSAFSQFDQHPAYPDSNYGRSPAIPELNPLQYNAPLKSSFNPQATAFDYWRTNRRPAAIYENNLNKTKIQRCRDSLEQLRRSNKAAYYNCGHHGRSQGVDISKVRNVNTKSGYPLQNTHLGSSSANIDCNSTKANHEPTSKSQSCSESYSQQALMSEGSSPIMQGVNTKGKGKEVMRTSATFWADMSRRTSSVGSIARATPCNRNHDASTQKNPLQRDSVQPRPKTSLGFNEADPHRDPVNTDEAIDSDPEDLGVISLKSESDGEDHQSDKHTESTPTDVQPDPNDEVKPHDIPQAPAQEIISPAHSKDTAQDPDSDNRYDALETQSVSPKSLTLCPNETQPPTNPCEPGSKSIKDFNATLEHDVQKNGTLKSRTSSAHRSASGSTAISERSWSAIVSGKYIPTKPSGSCPPQPTTTADSIIIASSVSLTGEATPTSHTLDPTERTTSPETLNSVWEHRLSNSSNRSFEAISFKSALTQATERSDGAKAASDSLTGVQENTTHKRIDGKASTETSQPEDRISKTPNIASTPQTQPAHPAQPSETAPKASAWASAAPEPPKKPQPRLWSQILGGSTNKFANTTQPSKKKDEASWPSLGSGGPSKGRKRNTAP
ncbi:hypothetical protein F4859DRAFT_510094 [Xylaria cf. heliscus]|nr:hypothetical protein F4859DRAFT_510094 [Xylaria cf. heliscus]